METTLIHEIKFNSAFADITIEDFQKLGFAFGDSCDVEFGDGIILKDVPFLDGYYVKNGEYLICGYQGYPHLQITANNSSTFWDDLQLYQGKRVKITLRETGKYLTLQNTFSLKYSIDRVDFSSDAEFANFRAMKGGTLARERIYRGASVYNDTYHRADYVSRLLEKKNVQFILNLSDSEEDYLSYHHATSYVENLYQKGKIAFLNMGSGYASNAFKESLAYGLIKMLESEGPYYIHCTEGKDRTGFVCAMLEALCGASFEQMKEDYMVTYANYYHITQQSDPDKYAAIVNLRFLDFMLILNEKVKEPVMSAHDYRPDARNYLLSAGLTTHQIDELVTILTEK